MKSLIIGIFAFLTTYSQILAQQPNPELLLGTWKKVETINSTKVAALAKGKANESTIFYFQEHGKLDYIQNGGDQHKASYQLNDTILTIGNNIYNVKNLTNRKLVLISINQYWKDTSTERFVKSDTNIVPLKEYETLTKLYPTGQKMSEGSYHNGWLNGKLTEWHKNGQLRHIGYYKEGKPTGKHTFWFENGQIKEVMQFSNKSRLIRIKAWDENGNRIK